MNQCQYKCWMGMRQYFKDQQQLQWYPSTHSLRSRILSRSVFSHSFYSLRHSIQQHSAIQVFLFSTSFCFENSPYDKHVTSSNNLLIYFIMSFIGEGRIYHIYIISIYHIYISGLPICEDVVNSDVNHQLLLLLLLLPTLTLYLSVSQLVGNRH